MGHIENLTREEKIKLLAELLDDLDVVVTACYGEWQPISGKDVEPQAEPQAYGGADVLIVTNIMTG